MTRVGTEDLPLFDWPERPAAPMVEQRPLPMPEVSIEAQYRLWRETPEGHAVWAAIVNEASLAVENGATRLSSKALLEWLRSRDRVPVNNSFTSHLARDLNAIPAFRGLVELRKRTAL